MVIQDGEKMSRYSTVSTKIPAELKAKMQKFKIKPSKVLRKAIEDEVKKREAEELRQEVEKLEPLLSKISVEEATRSVREDRQKR
jgi:hypothetical protein